MTSMIDEPKPLQIEEFDFVRRILLDYLHL